MIRARRIQGRRAVVRNSTSFCGVHDGDRHAMTELLTCVLTLNRTRSRRGVHLGGGGTRFAPAAVAAAAAHAESRSESASF